MVKIRLDLYMSHFEKTERHAIIQNDNEGVSLSCRLKNPDGTIYEVPEGAEVLFLAAKPDGTGVVLSTTDTQVYYNGNLVEVPLPQSVTAAKGMVLCKLIVQDMDKTASSQVFRLQCEADLVPGDLIESEEYQSLVTMLNHLGEREAEFDDMKAQFIEAISGITEDSEVINARVDGPYSTTYDTLKLRLDAMSALLKGIVDGDFENRVSDLEDEVEDARGEFDALVDRLDDTDGRIADNAGEIDSAKVKILQLEQENKQLKKIVEDSNPTQSPRVTKAGYGTIDLPKNASQGPMKVKVEGLTATNLINGKGDNLEGWDTGSGRLNTDGQFFTYNANTTGLLGYYPISFKNGRKYYCRVLGNCVGGDGTGMEMHFRVFNDSTQIGTLFWFSPTDTSLKQLSTVWTATADANRFGLRPSATGNTNTYRFGKIMVLDVSHESGSNEEIRQKYDTIIAKYFDGHANTSGTFRVRAIGKNIFDGEMELGTIVWGTGINAPSTANIRTKNYIKVKENTSYILTTNSGTKDFDIFFYDELKNRISSLNKVSVTAFTTPAGTKYIRFVHKSVNVFTNYYQLEEGGTATAYEPYVSSEQYVNSEELRSLPNGTKDEISEGKYIQRVNKYVVQGVELSDYASPTEWNIEVVRLNIDNLSLNPTGGANLTGKVIFENANIYEVSYNGRATVNPTGLIWYSASSFNHIYIGAPQGTWGSLAAAQTALAGVTLIYQLATPIEIPIEVSGTLLSYPSGTVYIEPAIADAGVYDGGFAILNTDFPIAELESVQKIDFQTGLSTELDVGQAVIAGGGLSFTHTGLSDGDIVFVKYKYDDSAYTAGKATCDYYDSRFVKKDTVNNKFYRIDYQVSNGVVTPVATEV